MLQRAVVGLQNLLSPASENPPMQKSSLAKCCKQKKRNIKKNAPQMEARVCRKMFETKQHMYDDDRDDDEDNAVDDDEEEEDEEDEDEDGDGDGG